MQWKPKRVALRTVVLVRVASRRRGLRHFVTDGPDAMCASTGQRDCRLVVVLPLRDRDYTGGPVASRRRRHRCTLCSRWRGRATSRSLVREASPVSLSQFTDGGRATSWPEPGACTRYTEGGPERFAQPATQARTVTTGDTVKPKPWTKSVGRVRAVWRPGLGDGGPDTARLRRDGRAPGIDRGQQHDGDNQVQTETRRPSRSSVGQHRASTPRRCRQEQQSTEQKAKSEHTDRASKRPRERWTW